MAVGNSVDSLICDLKASFNLDPAQIVGPIYQDTHKQLADFYSEKENEMKVIYHLTEAHGATLRQQTVIRYDYKEDLIKNKKNPTPSIPIQQGLQKTFVDFESDLARQEEEGLLSRLKEMPKEWTVVQVTRQCVPQEQVKIRPKDSPAEPSNLYITRLPCGEALEEDFPVTLLVEMPGKIHGMPTILELMKQAMDSLRTKNTKPREIRREREKGSQYIKDVAETLSNKVLKEWKCLFMGSLFDSNYREKVRVCIDDVVNSDKFKSYRMNRKDRLLLYRVADAAVHLTNDEIQSAVCCLVDSKELGRDLITAIRGFKDELSILLAARRHPVVLVIDEALDCLPWEMLPVFKKHPVSRVPSIHFLHALYHEHKTHIQNGCRVVTKLDTGFYVVNPDQDLNEMENRLMGFLEMRVPCWKGLSGTSPTDEQFCSALIDNNIFLYCGHFNGSHILRPEEVSKLRVVALPLLFGCSSVALQDLGGRSAPTGVSDKYLMAGCACVIGTLWTVTCDDIDCMTVMLLNGWLPGEPIDLKHFRPSGDILSTPKEPELLRLMRHARDVALAYSNSAALVARGIPIRMVES